MPRDEHAEAIRALADGTLDRWQGLPAGVSRSTLDAELNGDEASSVETGSLGDAIADHRTYPATPAAPFGVRAWLEGDRVLVLDVREPVLEKAPADLLGEPEAEESSGLGGVYRQWIYASRGLTLHVDEISGEVRQLYAYEPVTVEQFLDSALARVAVRRIPRER